MSHQLIIWFQFYSKPCQKRLKGYIAQVILLPGWKKCVTVELHGALKLTLWRARSLWFFQFFDHISPIRNFFTWTVKKLPENMYPVVKDLKNLQISYNIVRKMIVTLTKGMWKLSIVYKMLFICRVQIMSGLYPLFLMHINIHCILRNSKTQRTIHD